MPEDSVVPGSPVPDSQLPYTPDPYIDPRVSEQAPDPQTSASNNSVVSDVLDSVFASLTDEEMNFILSYMTPEIVAIIGYIAGPEVADYLEPLSNPQIVLVPQERDTQEQPQNGAAKPSTPALDGFVPTPV